MVTGGYTSASFADKNVGTGKTVTVSGITHQRGRRGQLHAGEHDGDDDSEHHGRATLTVSATGVNKVYDGTTSGDGDAGDRRDRRGRR